MRSFKYPVTVTCDQPTNVTREMKTYTSFEVRRGKSWGGKNKKTQTCRLIRDIPAGTGTPSQNQDQLLVTTLQSVPKGCTLNLLGFDHPWTSQLTSSEQPAWIQTVQPAPRCLFGSFERVRVKGACAPNISRENIGNLHTLIAPPPPTIKYVRVEKMRCAPFQGKQKM